MSTQEVNRGTSTYYSTKSQAPAVSLRDAVLHGLAPDGGLYFMKKFPTLPPSFIGSLSTLSPEEIATTVATALIGEDIELEALTKIVGDTLSFPIPLVSVEDDAWSLELFHGPTLAFKDVGARFMARLMSTYVANADRELTILVATSGDTGSAVADGFHGVPGISVKILYPSGRVSPLQEQQLTTYGGNVAAIELAGSFDDCQQLVKQAMVDSDLRGALWLSSANSINLARLIPQTFYYFLAVSQLHDHSRPVVISVPSGNFGNLTAGLIAKQLGLPIHHFVAATNINDTVPQYLASGTYQPKASQATISSAMDVGNPSNFDRMLELYNHDSKAMAAEIHGYAFDDKLTTLAIRDVHQRCGYLMDPHGAVAYLGLRSDLNHQKKSFNGIFLETAHPAKFTESVEEAIGEDINIPSRLQQRLALTKNAIPMANSFATFKEYLLTSRVS